MEKLTQKRVLRNSMKGMINTYNKDVLNKFSTQINFKLEQLLKTKKVRMVACFAPLPTEPNLWPLYKKIEAQFAGKELQYQLCFPLFTQVGFVPVRDTAELFVSKFKILEKPVSPLVNWKDIDLILVPGLAFDQQGNRIGRGGGYYDRVLAQLSKSTFKVGVCFPFQLVDQIPVEEHDQKVDIVIS